jgi:hypothetical protein
MSFEVTPGWFANSSPINRKIAEVFIAPEHILGIIQGKYKADPAIFPEDAQVVSGRWDETSRSFALIVSSKEYMETAAGNYPLVMSLRLKE